MLHEIRCQRLIIAYFLQTTVRKGVEIIELLHFPFKFSVNRFFNFKAPYELEIIFYFIFNNAHLEGSK